MGSWTEVASILVEGDEEGTDQQRFIAKQITFKYESSVTV